LKTVPRDFCGSADAKLNWFPHVHFEREYSTFASLAFGIDLRQCHR
jgi:hypothetical protein